MYVFESIKFATNLNSKLQTNPSLMIKFIARNQYLFAQIQKSPLVIQASLRIRNSQQLQMQMLTVDSSSSINFHIPKMGQLKDIADQIQRKVKISNVQFLCNDGLFLPNFTPTEAMLNRNFFIASDEYNHIPVVGQLEENRSRIQKKVEGLDNLQFCAVTRKDITQYIKRVSLWINLKYGTKEKAEEDISDKEKVITLPAKEAKRILVEALLDPAPQDRQVHMLESEFTRLYWVIQEMQQLRLKAEQNCRRKVRLVMTTGLGMIGLNIAFIWSGTYVIWSWDIVEPLAYFIDAAAGIVLTYQFFKMGRMYTHFNYQEYLFSKYLPKEFEKIGFLETTYEGEKLKMKKLEAVIKDHYIKKLC